MKKLGIITTLFVAALVMGMSTNVLANDCYDAGVDYAAMEASDFCGEGYKADILIPEECIKAAISGCKDYFLDNVEELCPEKIEDFSKFKKYLLVEQTCKID
ncbi:MAG: hypothetical protein GY874_05235 [Desulfobacteraceae bacterium]|nr:hypothetical protein [Desulfobacteraceae bacterium]